MKVLKLRSIVQIQFFFVFQNLSYKKVLKTSFNRTNSKFSRIFSPKVNSVLKSFIQRSRDIYISIKMKKSTKNNFSWGEEEAMHESRFYKK